MIFKRKLPSPQEVKAEYPLSDELAARVCDIFSVRAPVQLLQAAEWLCRELIKLSLITQDVC